jgi:hypothetical protein
LLKDITAGEKYDGELLAALKEIPVSLWRQYQDQARQVHAIVYQDLSKFDEDVRRDAHELMCRVEAASAL